MITCTQELFPCPPEMQQQAATLAEIYATLGITSASIVESVAWGFGFVVVAGTFGYIVGAMVKMLRNL